MASFALSVSLNFFGPAGGFDPYFLERDQYTESILVASSLLPVSIEA